jgi:hypothetical protein
MGAPVAAQDDAGWQVLFQPYLMLPFMNGDAAVRGFDADVDIGPSDIFDSLNIGLMGYVEAGNGTFAVALDLNYMNLDANADSSRVQANVSQTAVQPMLFYRVSPGVELMGGLRYNNIYLKLSSDLPAIDGQDRTKDWLDPIIGARFTAPMSNSSKFAMLANIGGFGIGSDIAVQAKPMFSFGVGEGITLDAGMQFVYMDYESGTGADRFNYDVFTWGPIFGATFRF